MKRIIVNQRLCSECGKCEEVCSETFFKLKDKEKAAIRIGEDPEEPVNVCSQCGKCIDVCSEEALTRAKNGVVLLNKNKCVGCYICAGFCPTLSMRMHKDLIEPFKCTVCGMCVKACPTGALSIEES